MKKRNSIFVIAVIGLIAVLAACQGDYSDRPPKDHWSIWDWFSDQDAPEISKAQAWYNQHGETVIKTKGGTHPLFDEMDPYWPESYVRKNEYCKTVEIALNARKRRKFVDNEASMLYDISKDERYLQSLTRLIIMTDLGSKKMSGFLMTIVPSLKYLEDSEFKPFYKNTYTERDKNFDGYIYYHELNGDFVNGWKYTNGEITHAITENSSSQVLTKSYNSNTYCQTVYELDCTDWFQTGEYTDESGTHSTDPQFIGTTCTPGSIGQICFSEIPTGGGGSGSGGGSSSSGGNTGGGSSSGGSSGGTSGGINHGEDNDTPPQPEDALPNNLKGVIKDVKRALESLKWDISNVTQGLVIQQRLPIFGYRADVRCVGTPLEALYGDKGFYMYLDDWGTTANKLIFAHEYYHLYLYSISRKAGSAVQLGTDNPALLMRVNSYGINDGHHQYMGYSTQDYEKLLRTAYPGETEEFYRYGKWGGGMDDSDEYKNLPKTTRDSISNYLIKIY